MPVDNLPTNGAAAGSNGRPLILYAYAESETARANFKFFIKMGLHAAADFVFIFNGDTDAAGLLPRDKDNIKTVQRANTCFDLGAYGEILRKDDLYKRYKRFIVMNASIRGPFLPHWAQGCWTDMYLNRLSSEVKVSSGAFLPEPKTRWKA